MESATSCSTRNDHENILHLKLNKPKSWNWEICTDISSSHIKFPRVILCDKDGTLLADIHKANCVKSNNSFNTLNYVINQNKSQRLNDIKKQGREYSFSVRIPEYPMDRKSYCIDNSYCTSVLSDEISNENISCNIDESEIPVYIYSGKGLILRNFKDKEFDEIRNKQKLNRGSQMRNTDFEAVTDKCFDKKSKSSFKLLTDLDYIPSATLKPQISFKSDDFDENIENLNDEYSIHTIYSSKNNENDENSAGELRINIVQI